ncbi:hypothetical protein N431DRAFT_451335 [Stipitochalara longipes BDJ]|nr:hypothetical protein N431DRAFT_451335 [Stipitochalara longipes BDJ]
MDPLSALSVAANIVQFVFYGINVVSKGNQLYKAGDGALIENAELEEATIRLQQLSKTFQESLDQSLPQSSSAQSEQALQKICEECKAVSQELIEKLEKLKVPNGHPHKKWKSFRQALKYVWTKEKFEEVAQRLAHLRMELDSHVLVSLRKEITTMSIQQNARFESLDNDTKKIMLALVANNEALLNNIESNFQALNLSSQTGHAKTRDILYHQAEANHRRKAELYILESLRFETMTYRPWSSFIKWAETGSGRYWINGKAGSGKSTLMRFIFDDPRIRANLEQWAPPESLNTPAFFFWNSGAPEQKSQVGLLRSIIYDVLQKHTELFPVVFSEEWRKAVELSRHGISAVSEIWSLSRLQKAFRSLVGCASKEFQFCFFIDGLDEYDGNHEDIAEYFFNLSSLPYIKFCVTSRPLIVFKDAFSTSPALRLHDLTSDDIAKYVKDKLNGHKRMKLLTEKDLDSSNRLVQGLINKAEGVFLWVTLVVTTLLKGLGQRDGFSQLLKRLKTFPSDLEQLYGHMLNSIDPIYMQEGARLFRIHRSAVQILGMITVEELYDAKMVDLPRVFGTTNEELRRAGNEEVELSTSPLFDFEEVFIYDPESLFEYMDHIVRTRCGGLIEFRVNIPSQKAFARYLHRTVREYLDREAIWKDICQHETNVSTFDPVLQLLMCQVLRLKRLSLFKNVGLKQVNRVINRIWYRASTICQSYRYWIPIDSLKLQRRLIHEFDREATSLNQNAKILSPNKRELKHWSNHGHPSAWNFDFLCEAIRCRLLFYVETRIMSNQGLLRRQSGLPLISFTFLASKTVIEQSQLEVLGFLLEQGADPNEIFMGHTMWQYFIHYLHTYSNVKCVGWDGLVHHNRVVIKKILESFTKRGADLDICCIQDDKVWINSVSDLLKLHVGYSENSSIKKFKALESSIKPDAADSIPSTRSLSPAILEKASPSVEHSSNEYEELAFEKRHSLTTLFREWFETEDDPHGADELLELMATLKAAKKASIGIQ